MTSFFNYLCLLSALLFLQSCDKDNSEEDLHPIDYFTYGSRFNWREDSIRMGNGDWAKIENGHVLSWLSQDTTLQNCSFGMYDNRMNLKTDFVYSIQADSVFALRQSSDSIQFPDENGAVRTDLAGQISFLPDTTLILQNTAVSPAISIKYKLDN